MKHQKSDTAFRVHVHSLIPAFQPFQLSPTKVWLQHRPWGYRRLLELSPHLQKWNVLFKTMTKMLVARCRVDLVPIEWTPIFYVQVSSTPGGRPPGIKWPRIQLPYWATDTLSEFHRTIWEYFRQMCRFLYLFTYGQCAISIEHFVTFFYKMLNSPRPNAAAERIPLS